MAKIFLLFVLSFANAAEFKDPKWLIRLTSTFDDDDGKKNLNIQGSGAVVQIGGRCFILTASHVSEGRNLRAFSRTGALEISSGHRTVDVDSDIALIPIADCNIKPLAYWDDDKLGIGAFVIPKDKVKEWGEKCSFWCADPINFVQVTGNGDIVPKGSWVNLPTRDWISGEHTHNFNLSENEIRNHGRPFLSEDMREVATNGMVVPGMSGAPMLSNAPMYGAVISGGGLRNSRVLDFRLGVTGVHYAEDGFIGGVANRYLRHFDRSFYSSPLAIANLVLQYKRGVTNSKTKWRLRNCLQYRERFDGLSEVNALSQNSGNGISGGPSDSCTQNESIGELSLNQSLKKWQIDYGLGDSSGRGIIAYKFGEKSFEANWAQALKLDKAQGVTKIYSGDSLWELFLTRMQTKNNYGHWSKECQVNTGADKTIHVFLNLVQKNNLVAETLEFTLNEFGSLSGDKFTPILELPSKSGIFKIDIRGLFFSDQTLITKPNAFFGQPEYDWDANIEPTLHINKSGVIDAALFCKFN